MTVSGEMTVLVIVEKWTLMPFDIKFLHSVMLFDIKLTGRKKSISLLFQLFKSAHLHLSKVTTLSFMLFNSHQATDC